MLTDYAKAFQPLLDHLRYLESLGIEELNSEYTGNIKISQNLGASGWLISAKVTPNNPIEWLHEIDSQGEETIAKYFLESDLNEMVDNIIGHYKNIPEINYLNRAIDNYYAGHYTESAMFLLATLDYRICCITPERFRKKTRQCDSLLTDVKKEVFDATTGRIATRIFFTADFIPSFAAYAKRVFIDGEQYNFDTGVEPPYLNRNWLMHGRMTRRVKRYECIQLINALNTLIDIEEELNRNGPHEI